MTTTTSPAVNVWQARAAARANAAKSDSSSSTVASSSTSTSTTTSVSTTVSLPLINDTDPFIVKPPPRNRPPPPLDDVDNWPEVGKSCTPNEPKKPIAESRKSEKPKSKWVSNPSQERAADTAPPRQLSSTSSGFNSSSQSRSHSRTQSQSGPSKEKERQTTDENAGPNHSRAANRDNSAAAAPQSLSDQRPPLPSTYHHPNPPPPRFASISHHQPPPVYPPYLHTPQFMDPTSSVVNNVVNGVNGMGYYSHSQSHTTSPHPPGPPPLPPPSIHHSHSHSSSMSIPYSYPTYYDNSGYDYATGMWASPGRSVPGSGAASGVNSGYQTPFYGPGHATSGKLMFGSIEGDTEISRGVNERGSTAKKGWAIGEGAGKRKKNKGRKENVVPGASRKGKGKAVAGVGMSEIVKKSVEKGDGKKEENKLVFGTTNSSSTNAPPPPFKRPIHLQTHLQQLPPLTVPVLSPIPPLPSILPTPMSSVPMPIQPLQSTYPPPQHSYYENVSLDDMSWMRQQQQLQQYPPSMGIFGGQVPSGVQMNGDPNLATREGTETREEKIKEGETEGQTDSVTKKTDEENVAVPPSATTDAEFEVRDFGYGFGRSSGSGYAVQDAREGIAARERERMKEREGRPYRGGAAGERSPVQTSPRFASRNLPPDGFPPRGRRGRGRGYRGDRGGRGWYGRGGYNNHNNGQFNSNRGHYSGGGSGGPFSPHNPYSPQNSNGPYPPYGQWAGQPGQYSQYGQYAQAPDPSFTLTPPPAFHPLPIPGDGEGAFYPPYYSGQAQQQPPLPPSLVNGQHSPSSSSSPQVPPQDGPAATAMQGSPNSQQERPIQANPHAPPLPTPITLLSFPLDPTRYYLLGQVEYYMSPQNMAQDLFLRQNMDSRGWIPITLIASFNRVRQLTTDENLVKQAMDLSSVVEVRGDVVRIRGEWERYVLPDAPISRVESGESVNMNVAGYYGGPPPMMGPDGRWYGDYQYPGYHPQQQPQVVPDQQHGEMMNGEILTKDVNGQPLPVPNGEIRQDPPTYVDSGFANEGVEEEEEEEEDEEDVVFVLGNPKETGIQGTGISAGMWSPDRRS
ncbi:hypothetical protein VKT23_010299 [Stygiomarasmius scandens]|uniref:HTH La-type RNA-binding domain-containing protein n=1 Tax=Marasmiellus scandens TaxID=2682957 RepID=A0ABR1JGG1_9AGAR